MAEPASSYEPLPFHDAVALLHGFRSGTAGDHLIPDPPLLVVRLDEALDEAPEDTAAVAAHPLRPPALLPCVVVAVANPASGLPAGPPPAGADIYLTEREDPPEPWVTCRDLGELTGAVGRNPQASTTLAQVLRVRSGDVEHDLVTESLAYAALQAGREHRDWLEAHGQDRPRAAPDEDGLPAVRVARSGETLDVVLDLPDRRNAYSARMRDELVAALQLASSDPTITAVRLRGNGRSFCSGGDLAEFGTVQDPATAHQIRATRSAGHLAHLVRDRLMPRVHGPCVGAGVELPAFAARVSAAPGTTFRLPEVGMGLIPGAGGTASIPPRIGRHRTAWLAITGCELDVATALRWGLIDRIDPG